MRDLKERFLNALNGIDDDDDDSPMFLSPNAERDYRESKKEYKKRKEQYEKINRELNAYFNTLNEGRKRLDEIKHIGK